MRPGVPPDESSSWGYFRTSRYLRQQIVDDSFGDRLMNCTPELRHAAIR
jgi:hypothetical protein